MFEPVKNQNKQINICNNLREIKADISQVWNKLG